jgi:hypothetical protein
MSGEIGREGETRQGKGRMENPGVRCGFFNELIPYRCHCQIPYSFASEQFLLRTWKTLSSRNRSRRISSQVCSFLLLVI